jgi:hypothetical protein
MHTVACLLDTLSAVVARPHLQDPSLSLGPGPLISNDVPLAPCHFCTVGHPYYGRGELLPRSTVFLGPKSPDKFPFSPYHFCTAGYLPAGGSRLPPVSLFSPGPFLRFLAALRAQIPTLCHFLGSPTDITAASPLGISSYSSVDWIGLGLLCICLRLSKSVHHPFMMGI